MSKSNIVYRLFTEKNLSAQLEEELSNLFNDEDFDKSYIIDNMDYLNDIEPTIETLRADYPNDNSFKSYLNVLTVITASCTRYQRACMTRMACTEIFGPGNCLVVVNDC
jgi:hypothetical protein